jgi:putative MATE family efflux protein
MVLILVFAVIAYIYVEPFFTLLGAQPHILPLTVSYMEIWLLGLPFFTVALVGSTLMRAAGDAVTPGYLMTIGSALHVVIAPFFIFGLGPAPEMGLEGAAVGFVLARTVSFCLYTYYIVFRDRLMIASLVGLWSSVRAILHVGLPAIASNLIGPVSMGVITRLLAGHGAEVVAGYGVASRVESMVVMVIIALGMSVAPFVGQNWGAGHHHRVRDALSLSNKFSLAWGLFAFIMMVMFAEVLVSLINDDPLVVQAATTYLIIVPISIGCMGVMMISTQSFNALGKPLPPLVISINQTLLVYIPLAILGDYLWGYTGIFIAMTVTTILLGAVSWYWLNHVIKSRINSV